MLTFHLVFQVFEEFAVIFWWELILHFLVAAGRVMRRFLSYFFGDRSQPWGWGGYSWRRRGGVLSSCSQSRRTQRAFSWGNKPESSSLVISYHNTMHLSSKTSHQWQKRHNLQVNSENHTGVCLAWDLTAQPSDHNNKKMAPKDATEINVSPQCWYSSDFS